MNAAQIMCDHIRDNEQVKLHSLQGQTRHMNKTIESVNFSRNIIVLVTHVALTNSKLCRIHNCSIPTDQPGPILGYVLLYNMHVQMCPPNVGSGSMPLLISIVVTVIILFVRSARLAAG